MDQKVLTLIAVAVIAALGGTGICLVSDDDGSIRVERYAAPAGIQLDKDNNISKAEAKEQSAVPAPADGENPVAAPNLANAGPDIHEDTRDETPPGISRDEADEAMITPPNPLPSSEEYKPQPVGGAQNFRCPENYVRNHSPRVSGVRVSMMVLHFTVSPPGSLRGIWNMFNNPASGASSTYLMELNGQCEHIVPYGSKPWTQMAFNSASESWEIVTNNLTRNEWLASPILRDATLARHLVSRLKARGLPPVLTDPAGCTPKAGVTDHGRLECGNNHWDVGPNFPWTGRAGLMADVKQIYKHGTLCGAKCKKINRQRAVVAGRKRKHRATHAAYRDAECRSKSHLHRSRLSDLTRDECRRLKRRSRAQHVGRDRAIKKLDGLLAR